MKPVPRDSFGASVAAQGESSAVVQHLGCSREARGQHGGLCGGEQITHRLVHANAYCN